MRRIVMAFWNNPKPAAKAEPIHDRYYDWFNYYGDSVHFGMDRETWNKNCQELACRVDRGDASLDDLVHRVGEVWAERSNKSKMFDNQLKWERSVGPKQWVERHRGHWKHGDWLALVEDLKASE